MNVGLLITSHKNYTAPLLCLLATAERFASRLIVSGGHEVRSESMLRGCQVVKADHDSYDYTALIEVVTHPELVDGLTHVLCVQDTMELGALTHELCLLADPLAEATAAAGGQCNLVLYRIEYLRQQADFILQRRCCTKHDSIRDEGAVWKMATYRHEFPFAGCVNLPLGYPYSDVPRLKEYYPSLQVVKWKANYGQNMHALIDSP